MVKQYDEPGRARRQCPECEKYVHVKVKQCPCGFDFDGYVQPKPQEELTPVEQEGKEWAQALGWSGRVVIAPAGKCPVKLKQVTRAGVKNWFERMLDHCYGEGAMYSPAAFRYYASVVVDMYNDKGHLNEDYVKCYNFILENINRYYKVTI